MVFALKANHCASLEKGKWLPVQKLNILDEGSEVWRRQLKDKLRHYPVCLPDATPLSNLERAAFCVIPDLH